MAALLEIEAKLGRKIGLPPAMPHIENDANKVPPEGVIAAGE